MPKARHVAGPRHSRLESLEPRTLLAADFELFSDVNQALTTEGSYPSDFVRLGAYTFFTATTGEHGRELWKSDGTAAGTVLVKDVNPGQQSGILSNGGPVSALVAAGDAIYFRANDGASGVELWKSDGTEAGTVRVKDIRPGDGVSPSFATGPWAANVNGTLFFAANDGASGVELWKSDGTEGGTVRVKDGVAGGGGVNPAGLVSVGGALMFRGGSNSAFSLWRSDGTDAGTAKVGSQIFTTFPVHNSYVAEANGQLFFSATNGSAGQELWRSDGTAAGTFLVKDIRPSASSQPAWLTNVEGTLYFTAVDAAHGRELWKSDGTAVGSLLVKDLAAGMSSTFGLPRGPSRMTSFGGRLYFSADAPNSRLWRSDGTSAGTISVSPISSFEALSFAAVDDLLYLIGTYASSGSGSLWYLDAAATAVSQVTPPTLTFSATPLPIYNSGGTLFFGGSLANEGTELMTAAGHPPTATFVKDIRQGTDSSSPENMFQVGGILYFGVYIDGAPQLWKSDGTAAGTVHVKTFDSHAIDGRPFRMANVSGVLYFAMYEPGKGSELWKSDGTEAGTVIIHEIEGEDGLDPDFLTNLDGILYFAGYDNVHGRELWRSDGTEAGTYVVKDISPGVLDGLEYSNAAWITVHDGVMYFAASSIRGNELWRSDGTAAGTYLVKEFAVPPSGAVVGGFGRVASADGYFYFFIDGYDASPRVLWRTDGTEAGTVEVGQALSQAGAFSNSPPPLIAFHDRLFFVALVDEDQEGLWTVVDGQIELVGSFGTNFTQSVTGLYSVGDSLFIVVSNGFSSSTLWKLDGATEGATPVLLPPGSVDLSAPTIVGDALYFVSSGQVWRVNAWENETLPISDFFNAGQGTWPQQLANVGGLLFFSRDDSIHGRELWVERSAAGDFSHDQFVDGADILRWQRQLGDAVFRGSGADGNESGGVDAADVAVWQSHYEAPESLAAAASENSAAQTATLDSLYAVGDFTALFTEARAPARAFRPARRAAGW